jgi:hypothetical protein
VSPALKLGLILAAIVGVCGCPPAQLAKDETAVQNEAAKVEPVVATILADEDKACLAANFLPGTLRTDAITACTIAEGVTSLADAFLQKVEAKRATASVTAAKAVVQAVSQDGGSK